MHKAQVACPEGYGTPPHHIANHTGPFTQIIITPAGDERVSLGVEICDLREALVRRSTDCNRSCGIGTANGALRRSTP